MKRGYIKLWRKSLDAGWLKNHKLWVFWSYCLLKASHKQYDAIVGLQIIHLMPGQFIFGFQKASAETGLTTRQIRTVLAFLKNAGNLTVKTTNKFSVITIINWATYQFDESENDKQNDKQRANKRQHTRTKEQKNNTPAEISEKILVLKSGYPNPELIDRAFDAIRSTRKSGKVADSILLAQLEKWAAYPQGQVEAGIRTYLEKEYAAKGKNEKYLLGIIRNGKPKPELAVEPREFDFANQFATG